jgi:hypothetical protein
MPIRNELWWLRRRRRWRWIGPGSSTGATVALTIMARGDIAGTWKYRLQRAHAVEMTVNQCGRIRRNTR